MISPVAIFLAVAQPVAVGSMIPDGHGEGLVAGTAVLNDTGYWETDFDFGEVGASPVYGDRRAIIEQMLRGEPLDEKLKINRCTGQLCTTGWSKRVKWPRNCEVRDLYEYREDDAVRVEWTCKGEEGPFNIVDFKDGIPVQFRTFDADRTIWIKDEQ